MRANPASGRSCSQFVMLAVVSIRRTLSAGFDLLQRDAALFERVVARAPVRVRLVSGQLAIIAHRRDGWSAGLSDAFSARRVPFVPCRETRSSNATEPPSGDSSTLSSSSGGEPASEDHVLTDLNRDRRGRCWCCTRAYERAFETPDSMVHSVNPG